MRDLGHIGGREPSVFASVIPPKPGFAVLAVSGDDGGSSREGELGLGWVAVECILCEIRGRHGGDGDGVDRRGGCVV